jgi:hypothetical protein
MKYFLKSFIPTYSKPYNPLHLLLRWVGGWADILNGLVVIATFGLMYINLPMFFLEKVLTVAFDPKRNPKKGKAKNDSIKRRL